MVLSKKWALVAIIAVGLGGMYYINQKTYPVAYVAKETIPRGAQLKADLFRREDVLSKKEWMISDLSQLRGYASQTINPNTFISRHDIQTTPLVLIGSGEGIIGIKATNKEDIVGWQLDKGDLVTIEYYDRQTKQTIRDPLLEQMTVVALINREGKDIAFLPDNEKNSVETVNLKTTSPDQEKVIDEYARKGDLRLVKRFKEESK